MTTSAKGEYGGGNPGEVVGMKPRWRHGIGHRTEYDTLVYYIDYYILLFFLKCSMKAYEHGHEHTYI